MTESYVGPDGVRRIRLVQERPCGSCSLCCKLMSIGDTGGPIKKEAGVWCEFCRPGRGGCTIYESRPEECRTFLCLHAAGIPALPTRPDRLKAFFATTSEEDSINLFIDPGFPDRLNHPEVERYVRFITEHGVKVKVWCGEMRRMFVRGDQVAAMIPEGRERDEFIATSGRHRLNAEHQFELVLEPLESTADGGETTRLKSAGLWRAA